MELIHEVELFLKLEYNSTNCHFERSEKSS